MYKLPKKENTNFICVLIFISQNIVKRIKLYFLLKFDYFSNSNISMLRIIIKMSNKSLSKLNPFDDSICCNF